MRIDNSFFAGIEAAGALGTVNNAHKAAGAKKPGKQFDAVLQEAENQIVFSKHAMKRLDERGIEITENQLDRLSSAIEMAQAKGIKDSLVLMDGKAFIVNVPSNTVITVMDGSEVNNQKVFSNLNGAVVL